jgi:acyl-CoA synthetase (AMP-forming)/AMP-acid ligase II
MSVGITATDPLLPEIFSLHGKWLANKPALVADGRTLNWRDFNDNLNKVANGLIALGLDKGDRVVVLMSNGAAMAECLFGIMKAGLVSAPLNTSVSDDAIANMVQDSGAKALIATADQTKRLDAIVECLPREVVGRRICAEGEMDGWTSYEIWRDAHSAISPDLTINPDDLLNIIYSSGTTGQPKGIVHTHKGRRDWAYDLAIALRYHGNSKFLATIGLYSNISWVGMLCTLLAGGTLFISRKFDIEALWKQIETDRITHLAMVPIQYQRMMEMDGHDKYDASSLTGLMSAGSPLHENLKASIFDRIPCGIIELYGLTEGVITTLEPEDARDRLASVGLPLIGTDFKILDDQDRECAPGQSGEIVSCGRIVMPGYFNRPEATLEARWRDTSGRDWLRTGDIGYLDDENYLYIVDRKKDMILSGGQNIYPQDIEAVLIQHDAVSDSAVFGVKSEKWGETPIAVVVKAAAATENEILDWCNMRLGKQQRLADVKFVVEIPRNPNGKILKRRLRAEYKDTVYG